MLQQKNHGGRTLLTGRGGYLLGANYLIIASAGFEFDLVRFDPVTAKIVPYTILKVKVGW